MKPRIARWLVCSWVTALAACLNPLPDDTPSSAETSADRHDGILPGDTLTPQPNGGVISGPAGESDDFSGDVAPNPPASEGSPGGEGSSSPDAGAPDAGALRTSEAMVESDLAPDAGSSRSP